MQKILQVISKNTSTLDYIIPVYSKINSNNIKLNIEILILKFSVEDIIKKNSYYYNFLHNNNIKVICLMDLINNFVNENNIFNIYFKLIFKYKTIFLYKFIIKIFEKKIDFKTFLSSRNYSLIILDNRSGESGKFLGYEKFYEALKSSKIKHLIIPHAPHFNDKHYLFDDLVLNEFRANKNTYIWYPFQYTKITEEDLNLCASIDFIGYPGFDSNWIENNLSNIDEQTILYLGRKQAIFPKAGGEYVTYGYLEQIREFNEIYKCIKNLGIEKYKFIYKMHPSGKKSIAKSLLFFSKLRNYEISDECIYFFKNKIKYVISPYSTIALFFYLTNSTTIIIENRILKTVKSKWNILNYLYSNLTISISELENIKKLEFRNTFRQKIVRDHFPDNATDNAIRKLNNIIYG